MGVPVRVSQIFTAASWRCSVSEPVATRVPSGLNLILLMTPVWRMRMPVDRAVVVFQHWTRPSLSPEMTNAPSGLTSKAVMRLPVSILWTGLSVASSRM